ncbi:MAG: hypothetical protein H0X13_13205, partial [Ramlibacter sp.]|nr:hypothetical protein [Ramlibacter sp.]
MAGRTRLSAHAGARLAALLALVLLVHMLTLNWLSRHLDGSPLLRPLATPMFTRVLRPEPPAAVPAPPPTPVAAARTLRPQVTSVARPASAPAPSGVPTTPATPTAPEPPPQPVAEPAHA